MSRMRPAEVHLRIRRVVVDGESGIDVRDFPELLRRAVSERLAGTPRSRTGVPPGAAGSSNSAADGKSAAHSIGDRVADVLAGRIGGARG